MNMFRVLNMSAVYCIVLVSCKPETHDIQSEIAKFGIVMREENKPLEAIKLRPGESRMLTIKVSEHSLIGCQVAGLGEDLVTIFKDSGKYPVVLRNTKHQNETLETSYSASRNFTRWDESVILEVKNLHNKEIYAVVFEVND
jgi:hypothetical protein